MKILDRYIGMAVIGGTMLVMSILLALFSFIEFINEMESIGRGRYGPLQAGQYILLTLPRLTYEVFPVSALIGSLVGLGVLASNSELIVIRAAGVSLTRIVISMMKAGLLLVIIAIIIGEFIASKSEQAAQELRSSAMADRVALKTKQGFWTREGTRFINVRAVLPGGELSDLKVYDFENQRLRTLTSAKSAVFSGNKWHLIGIARSEISENKIITEHASSATWDSLINPDLLDVITIKPKSMSAWELFKYIEYLDANELGAARYEMEFWSKVFLPFSTGVMVFLAAPFVFGHLRSVGVGQRILVGTLVGLAFYVFDQMFSYVGLVYNINPLLSTLLPTLIFLGIAIRMMRRIY